MRMLSVLAVLAAPVAVAFASPALAKDEEKGSFEHGGYTYVYEVQQQGSAQLISGRRYPGATPFSLRVRNGEVSGTSNGMSVNFNVSEAAGAAADAKPVEISMR